MRRLPGALVVLAALLAPRMIGAQEGWALDLSAGRAVHDPLSARIGTDNLMLGVRYAGARPAWFYLSGGAPLATVGPRWGAMGLGGRIAAGGSTLAAGLDLGSHLFGYSFSAADTLAGGATLELLPGIFAQWGSLGVELHSGLVQYTLALPEETTTRRVHQSTAQATLTPLPALALVAESRFVRTPEGDYPYAGGTLQISRDRLSAWAGAGRWLSDAMPAAFYGVGTSLRLGEQMEAHASWQQEASDPLYWNAPRRSWAVRISHRLSRRTQAPTPRSPTSDGRTILRIPVESSDTAPYVLGDFTGWQPVPMVRSGRHWEVALAIAPGIYHYGFRTEEGRWFIPLSVTSRTDDGMGGTSAVLVVP
ncbi:hypothetical protein BH24GEM3_BH24GEM3_09050 [soil metagenome]